MSDAKAESGERKAEPRVRRPRDWQKPKRPGACCAMNLGPAEKLPGTALKFQRCGICNRRHFLPTRERETQTISAGDVGQLDVDAIVNSSEK